MADLYGNRSAAGNDIDIYRHLGIFYFLALQGGTGRVKGDYFNYGRSAVYNSTMPVAEGDSRQRRQWHS